MNIAVCHKHTVYHSICYYPRALAPFYKPACMLRSPSCHCRAAMAAHPKVLAPMQPGSGYGILTKTCCQPMATACSKATARGKMMLFSRCMCSCSASLNWRSCCMARA